MNGGQITMIAILAYGLTMNMLRHGEDRPQTTYSFPVALISFLIEFGILTWGGFWE